MAASRALNFDRTISIRFCRGSQVAVVSMVPSWILNAAAFYGEQRMVGYVNWSQAVSAKIGCQLAGNFSIANVCCGQLGGDGAMAAAGAALEAAAAGLSR